MIALALPDPLYLTPYIPYILNFPNLLRKTAEFNSAVDIVLNEAHLPAFKVA